MEINFLTPIKIDSDILFLDFVNQKLYSCDGNLLDDDLTQKIIKNISVPSVNLPTEVLYQDLNKADLLRKIKNV